MVLNMAYTPYNNADSADSVVPISDFFNDFGSNWLVNSYWAQWLVFFIGSAV
jgi:hypothetical protein